MRIPLLIVGTVLVVAVVGPIPERPASVLFPSHENGCKPHAPVAIDVIATAERGGVVTIDYRVEARIDAADVVTTIELRDGGRVVSHAPASGLKLARGDRREGRTRVRLPGPARVTLRAEVVFPADGGGPLERQVREETIVFGDVDLGPNLPVVYSGAEPSLDVPALRVGGDGR